MIGRPNVELREFLRSRRATVTPAAAGQRRSIRSLGRGILEDLDHLVIEQLGNV
jgi:hypothetical protein